MDDLIGRNFGEQHTGPRNTERKTQPQTQQQGGKRACAFTARGSISKARIGWRSCCGHGRTQEAMDCSSDSPKFSQVWESHRNRTNSGGACSVERRQVQRSEKCFERTRPQQNGCSVASACQTGAHECPWAMGERQEHLDAVVAFVGAGQRRRMFRVLDILTVKWAMEALRMNVATSIPRGSWSSRQRSNPQQKYSMMTSGSGL